MKTISINILCCLIIIIAAISCKNTSAPVTQNEYKVMTIGLEEKTLSTSYPATIKGCQDIEIRPQISGLITEVRVKEGENMQIQRSSIGQSTLLLNQGSCRFDPCRWY